MNANILASQACKDKDDVKRLYERLTLVEGKTGEIVTLMEELYSTIIGEIVYVFSLVKHYIFLHICDRENNCADP